MKDLIVEIIFNKFCRPEQSNPCHCEELRDEAIHKTNCKKYCRPEFISGPIPCGAEKLNLKDNFFALLAGKMLKQVQHDMFNCHCEELCDEAIHKEFQTTESRGVKCQ